MSTLLKDLYSPSFYAQFADFMQSHLDGFDRDAFLSSIFEDTFEQLELKDRMRHTAKVMHQFLPDSIEAAYSIIANMIDGLSRHPDFQNSFVFMFFPEYVAEFGIEHFEPSVRVMEKITQFVSCEFAVRPFLVKYPEQMLAQMHNWSLHAEATVRRLASEGSRPRLPWGMAVPGLKQDPRPLLPILERLKDDPSEMVRRSVANSLNDISKDHPHLLYDVLEKWQGRQKETDALLKHASRTLLKAGDPMVLQFFGLDSSQLQLLDLQLKASQVKIPSPVEIAFEIENLSAATMLVRIEYAIYFLKQNGTHYKKVFKISERQLEAQTRLQLSKSHSFRPITTRTYYPGQHAISVILNGVEKGKVEFELLESTSHIGTV